MGAGTKVALIIVFVLLVVVIALAVKNNSAGPVDLAARPEASIGGAGESAGGAKATESEPPSPSAPPAPAPEPKKTVAPEPAPGSARIEPEPSSPPPAGEIEGPGRVEREPSIGPAAVTPGEETFGPPPPVRASDPSRGSPPGGTGAAGRGSEERGSAPSPSVPEPGPIDPGPPAPVPAIDDGTGKIEPSSTREPGAPKLPPPPSTYTVREGDSLWDIAVRLYGKGALFTLIKEANALQSENDLRPGMVLKIPAPPPPPPQLPPEDPKYWYHIAAKGETLWGLAEKYLKDSRKYAAIVDANPELKGGAMLREGMRIRIPKP